MINLSGMVLNHIQISRPDVLWVKHNKADNSYQFDSVLPNPQEIESLIASFDPSIELTKKAVKDLAKNGEQIRKDIIKDMKAEVIYRLYSDQLTFVDKSLELKQYVNSAGVHIFNYLMSSLPNDLISYTSDQTTLNAFPVLNDEYVTGQTISEYIISRLV